MLGVLVGDSAPQTRVSRLDHTFLLFLLSNCGFWYHNAHAVQVWCQKTEVEISKMALKSAKNGKKSMFCIRHRDRYPLYSSDSYTPGILVLGVPRRIVCTKETREKYAARWILAGVNKCR